MVDRWFPGFGVAEGEGAPEDEAVLWLPVFWVAEEDAGPLGDVVDS